MTPLAVFLALLVAFAYGLSPVLQKLILTDVSVETMLFLLGVPVAIGFLVFVGIHHKKVLEDFTSKKISKKVVGRVILLGIFCALIPYLMYAYLLKNYKSHYVAALVAAAPVFTLFLTKAIFGETLSILSMVGVALIVGGVASIIVTSGKRADPINE